MCVRVLQNLIKACSLRFRGVGTIPPSRQCKLLTCKINCAGGGFGGGGAWLFSSAGAPVPPPVGPPVCRRQGPLHWGALITAGFFCVSFHVYTRVHMHTHAELGVPRLNSPLPAVGGQRPHAQMGQLRPRRMSVLGWELSHRAPDKPTSGRAGPGLCPGS